MISKIAKYPIEAEIGRGGCGVVYRAYDHDVGRHVAIKVLTTEADPELFKRFQDEVGTTGNLIHSNIVIVYESGSEAGAPYLVMELLTGRTLQAAIKAGELTLLEKVRVMTQVAEGLKFAHSKNVIHRDVKPGNIMLQVGGNVKIMDFGIARVTTQDSNVTREGFILGTIPYMAPEQFTVGTKADKQTDIFSYGAVYYELLTGKHPFSVAGGLYATVYRIQHEEPTSIRDQCPDCPEALELLILRALAKDREVRYQGFKDLLLDSEAILSDLAHDRALVVLEGIRPLIGDGDLDQIDADNLDAAERQLMEVVALDPGNREARQLRRDIIDAKERRKAAARLPAMLEESDAHMKARRFSEAVHTLEGALRLARNDKVVQTRLDEAQAKLQAHRQANKLVSEARRNQQTGDLGKAVDRLKTALDLDADHTDAKALYARLDTELRRRNSERQVEEAVSRALEHRKKGRYTEALAALDELGPVHVRVTDLRARIEQEQQDDERRKKAERFNVTVSEIRDAIEEHELTKATELLDRLVADFGDEPDNAPVLFELQQQLQAQIRADAIAAFSQQARDLMRQKAVPEALEVLREAAQRFPDDTGLRRLRDSAEAFYAGQQRTKAMAEALEEANLLRGAGELGKALDSIAAARNRIGEDRTFDDLEQQFRIEIEERRYASGLEQLLSRVQGHLDAAEYAEAIRTIQAAFEYASEPELQAALASAATKLARHEEQLTVQSILQTIEALEKTGEYERAAISLGEARQKYPRNPVLAQAADRVAEKVSKCQRESAIANHRARIDAAMKGQQWDKAESAIQLAQREYPEEFQFESLASQLRRTIFDAGLTKVSTEVRKKLGANAVTGAVEQINETRTVYFDDPRWKELEQEVAQRQAYESGLGHANSALRKHDLSEAEALLTGLMKQGSFDARLTQMLAEVQQHHTQQELDEANQAIARGDFDRGMKLLETARANAPPEWLARIDQAVEEASQKRARDAEERERNQAIQQIAGIVQDLAARKEFMSALTAVEGGLREFPESESLRQIWEQVRARARAADRDAARRLEQAGKFAEALQSIEAALRAIPQDPELLEYEAGLTSRIEQERRQAELDEERDRVAGEVAALVTQGEPQDDLITRARALSEERPEEALRLIEPVSGQTAELIEFRRTLESRIGEQRRLEVRGRIVAQLIAIEQQIEAKPRKGRIKQLAAEAARIGAPSAADPKVAAILSRIEVWVESAEVAPSGSRGPVVAGLAIAAVAVVAVVIFLKTSIKPPAPSAVEIVSDPAGALVSAGGHSCVAPCRLDLLPGNYQFHAELKSYKTKDQPLTIAGPARLTLSLDPESAPPVTGGGTLVVQAGLADALVFADNAPRGRTGPDGTLSVALAAKTYHIRVQRTGYQTPLAQQVRITSGHSQVVAFKLVPQRAQLEVRGAPAGVEIRIGDAILGRTDGGVFSAPVDAGDQMIRLTNGTGQREFVRTFEGGQTLTLDWSDVAPASRQTPRPTLQPTPQPTPPPTPQPTAPPTPQPTPTEAASEARDWERARGGSEAEVQDFLKNHPNGPHLLDARNLLDDLAWGTGKDPDGYLRRFPEGRHANEAKQANVEASWKRVDQNNEQALRVYLRENPNGSHAAAAQTILEQLAWKRLDKTNEPALRAFISGHPSNPHRAEAQTALDQLGTSTRAVLAALEGFNGAFEHKSQRELRQIWPTVPRNYLEAVVTAHAGLKLDAPQPPEVSGDRAIVRCMAVTEGSQTRRRSIQVTLQKQGDNWIILTLLEQR